MIADFVFLFLSTCIIIKLDSLNVINVINIINIIFSSFEILVLSVILTMSGRHRAGSSLIYLNNLYKGY